MKLQQLFEGRGINLIGYHYSHNANLDYLDPKKHGTGIRGAERTRARDYPEYYNKERVYLYSDPNKKESGLGNNKYKAKLIKVYDMVSDPDGLKKKAQVKAQEISGVVADMNLAATLFENMILEKGYNGYYNKKAGIIIYFKKVDVEKAA